MYYLPDVQKYKAMQVELMLFFHLGTGSLWIWRTCDARSGFDQLITALVEVQVCFYPDLIGVEKWTEVMQVCHVPIREYML